MSNAKTIFIICIIFYSCSIYAATNTNGKNWADKLGYPKGSRVVILHADDIGMCYEANQAAKSYLKNNNIQSAAVMVPCPWFNEFAAWAINNQDKDIGLHLTLTSEWQTYRWGGISDSHDIPGLLDGDGYLWRDVRDVVSHASPEEVEKEIRAQIDRSIKMGLHPTHIDTHMGTLYSRVDYAEVFFKVAMDYDIPANVIEFTPTRVEKFRKQGYPITEKMIENAGNYTLPKLDDFFSVPNGKTYEEKKANFFKLIRSLEPGISEIIFHPSVNTEGLKKITNSWQQRVWEAKMFSDTDVIQFMEDEDIIFTNWKDMMNRFRERGED
jgi:predicted glycoside hydrolase/deacetylase ChbG (UPF0249 family)